MSEFLGGGGGRLVLLEDDDDTTVGFLSRLGVTGATVVAAAEADPPPLVMLRLLRSSKWSSSLTVFSSSSSSVAAATLWLPLVLVQSVCIDSRFLLSRRSLTIRLTRAALPVGAATPFPPQDEAEDAEELSDSNLTVEAPLDVARPVVAPAWLIPSNSMGYNTFSLRAWRASCNKNNCL